jgi:hypothetical protein
MIVRRIRPESRPESSRPPLTTMERRGKKRESSGSQPPLNGSMSMISTAILLPLGAL